MLRNRIAEHPRLYLPVAGRRYPDAVLTDETDLVIDGFTRSAVTFTSIAFQLAQSTRVRVAFTLHSVGHILAAAERGVPALVTIRDPDQVALSAVIREPFLSIGDVMAAYSRFYGRLWPVRRSLAVVSFDQVVTDLGSVIRQLNAQFSTSFDEFEHTEQNVRLCYGIIDDRSKREPWLRAIGWFQGGKITYEAYLQAVESRRSAAGPDRQVPERSVPRPSRQREAFKDRIREALGDPRIMGVRTRALLTYRSFLQDER